MWLALWSRCRAKKPELVGNIKDSHVVLTNVLLQFKKTDNHVITSTMAAQYFYTYNIAENKTRQTFTTPNYIQISRCGIAQSA